MKKSAIPLRPIDRILEFLAIAAWLFSVLYIIWFYNELPERVAIHFNSLGEADGWSQRGSAFIVPLAFAFALLLLSLLSRYFPKDQMNYPGSLDESKRDILYPISRTMMHGLQLSIGLISTYATIKLVNTSINGDFNSGFFDTYFLLTLIMTPIIIYFYYYFKTSKE